MPDISIIHPSRGRSSMAFETAKLWANNASNPKGIEYILSLDRDDSDLVNYENYFYVINKFFGTAGISRNDNRNVVQAANGGAKYATGKIFVLLSDDFSCEAGWDSFILANIDSEKEEALAINDGLQPIDTTILTLPILTKKLYDKLGYIYYPEYSGICADNDLAEMCDKMGVLKRNYTKVFKHLHWVGRHKQRDETNNRHDNPAGWKLGKEVYQKRKANNFNL